VKQLSFLLDTLQDLPSLDDEISGLLKLVKNRMYTEECLDRESEEVKAALMQASDKSGILPWDLVSAARKWVIAQSNLSAIQAIRYAAGVPQY